MSVADTDVRLPLVPPEVGQLVQVRQRTWLVERVIAPPEPDHSARVALACADDDAQGEELEVFWDCEPDRRIIASETWATLGARGFDSPRRFAAYVNTLRWNSVSAADPGLLLSPFRAGIKLDAYQMEPLRMALGMPRVRLFIADDTGLGKTIEAGLIARELLLRKKVQTIVVAAPASVLEQWRAEMEERFGLRFEILDRNYFGRMRLDRGYGVNPWSTHSRFLVSHNLLTSETYAAPMRDWLGAQRAGSLLILDEAHHAAPSSGGRYGIESQFTRAVRELGGLFEHRLFLSATPHNGHSSSFSTLMELLDPYRFTRGVKVSGQEEQAALRRVMVRRLKEDIRETLGGFPRRIVEPVVVDGLPEDAPELALSRLLDQYRELRDQRFRVATRSQRSAAALLTVGLQQRLLSSVEAFARSLSVHQQTVKRQWEKTSGDGPVATGEGFIRATGADDEDLDWEDEIETEDAEERAAEAADAEDRAAVEALDRAAEAESPQDAAARALWTREQAILTRMAAIAEAARGLPDAKTRKLLDWIRENLCPGMPAYGSAPRGERPRWNNRRVLIFTENREGTKRYLRTILETAISGTDRGEERIETIDGLVAGARRREIQRRFNAPPEEDPLRILLATDAAREGLNFQAHCTDLFHFDLPWNPGRIEQRNGRIDRKLQPAGEVRCRYFKLPQRQEDRVLEVLVRKTETIKRELGSLSKVIEDDIERRLKGGIRHRDSVQLAVQIEGAQLEAERRRVTEEELDGARSRQDALETANEKCRTLLDRSRKWVGFEEDAFRDALSCSLEMLGADPLRPTTDDDGNPIWEFPPVASQHGWEATLDALRAPRRRDQKLTEWREKAAIRPVVFKDAGRLTDDRVHLHLEQRVARRLLSRFRAQGFVHNDLSRACLVQAADSIPRVVLLGRLCLFGRHAERLHEELTFVTAGWAATSRRNGPLQPYARKRREFTMDLLKASLSQPGRTPGPIIAERLLGSAPQDIADLLPHLEEDALARTAQATTKLQDRGEKEAKDLVAVLTRQRGRVAEELRRYEGGEGVRQLRLFDTQEEKRQLEANMKAWRDRIETFDQEMESEPQRIREFHEVKATRFEPVGLAYLWPETN